MAALLYFTFKRSARATMIFWKRLSDIYAFWDKWTCNFS